MPKIDKIEYEKRIRIVQEWILEDWPSVDIISQIGGKWGLEERQAKRYISEGRRRWVNEVQILIEHKRKLKVQSLNKLKRSLKEPYKGTPAGINAITRVEDRIIKLEALDHAKKFEITGKDGKPIQTEILSEIDYAKLSDEVLLAIMNAKKDE